MTHSGLLGNTVPSSFLVSEQQTFPLVSAAPARTEPGPLEKLAFDQNSSARLKRAVRMPARSPGSRVALFALML